MRRLTPTEVKDWQTRFCQWHSPTDVQSHVDEVMTTLGSAHLFTQAGLAFVRDAWIAGKFAAAINADFVRLVADEWPDFETKASTTERIDRFEAVEADQPGRRRGLEYSAIAERLEAGEILVEDDPVEDWAARAEQAPRMLRDAAERKVKKGYAGRCHLVIYLNLSEFGIRQSEVEGCMATATAPAKARFENVWVLWKDRAYKVWENGAGGIVA